MAGPGCATHLEADECARREFIEPSRAEPNPRAEGSGSGESSAAVEACGVPPIPPPSGSGESSDEAERAPSSAAASAASSLAYCSHFCACHRDAGGKGPGFPRVSWLQDILKCCAPAGLLRAKSLWGLCGGECPEDTRRSVGRHISRACERSHMKTMFMMWSVLASTATFSALACGGFAAAISEKQPRTQVGRKHDCDSARPEDDACGDSKVITRGPGWPAPGASRSCLGAFPHRCGRRSPLRVSKKKRRRLGCSTLARRPP